MWDWLFIYEERLLSLLAHLNQYSGSSRANQATVCHSKNDEHRLCREQAHVVERLHRSMLGPLAHTFVIRQLSQSWCLLMSEHSQAPPWTCWKYRPAPLPPTSSWCEYLDEFFSSFTEADHVQHKFLSGYKTCMENLLHKLKQRVETQDAAEYQKLNVNCVRVFCSSVQGMFTSV